MTTYNLTMMGLTKAQAWALIASVPAGVSFKFETVGDEPAEPKKPNGKATRRTGDAALMLTGREAKKGTIRDKALKQFMKLEQKHGPGGVTRTMFRAELNKLGADASTLNSLITAGLIKHVED